MKLRIMTKDIRGAKRNDWDHCPIARAAKRTWPGNDVQVFTQHISVNGITFSHTDSTREYSAAWDDGPVRAMTLEIPDIAHALNNRWPSRRTGK